jgi:ribosomal protein S18 acetylase RimI-like enzyme
MAMRIHYRAITPADARTLFAVSERAIGDFARRQGYAWDQGADDAALWARRQPLYERLAAIADRAWLAEDEAGRVIGYARSIAHDGVRELTEFFVLPAQQSAGVGRELLRRVFPAEGATRRFIVATSDTRAMARYLKSGVYARFPIFEFRRAPEAVPVPGDVNIEPMGSPETLANTLAGIDQQVLGFTRPADHTWLAQQRTGFVARRAGEIVGYGYLGNDAGPFAVLAEADMTALLAHAEVLAHQDGRAELNFEVPLINRAAVQYLLGRGFKFNSFFAFFMSDGRLGNFENYVLFSPPFFV